MLKRMVTFFVEGRMVRQYETDRPLHDLIRGYIKDARIRGVHLEGKSIRVETADGEVVSDVFPESYSSTAQRTRVARARAKARA
ncbi:MAG: hypothetical protein ACRD0K_17855 [Egibacteraceae bacterium]